jgi:hypothetical protein
LGLAGQNLPRTRLLRLFLEIDDRATHNLGLGWLSARGGGRGLLRVDLANEERAGAPEQHRD